MPSTYNFRIETTLSAGKVIEIAARANNTVSKDFESPFTFSVDYVFVVGVEHSNNAITKQVHLEEYGFVPTVDVTFEHGYSIDSNLANPIIKRSIVAMLKEIQGNAVLLYNYEDIKLKRFNNKCDVEENHYYNWLTKGLDEAGLKYMRKVIINSAVV